VIAEKLCMELLLTFSDFDSFQCERFGPYAVTRRRAVCHVICPPAAARTDGVKRGLSECVKCPCFYPLGLCVMTKECTIYFLSSFDFVSSIRRDCMVTRPHGRGGTYQCAP